MSFFSVNIGRVFNALCGQFLFLSNGREFCFVTSDPMLFEKDYSLDQGQT